MKLWAVVFAFLYHVGMPDDLEDRDWGHAENLQTSCVRGGPG